MPNFKGSLFFENTEGEGFSEGYYGVFTDGPTAVTALETLADARLNMLDPAYFLVYAKVHNLATPRAVLLTSLLLPAAGTYAITSGGFNHSIFEAVLLRLMDVTGFQNRKFIHGTNTDTSHGDIYLPGGSWATALAPFIADLVASWSVARGFSHGVPSTLTAITSAVPERVTEHRIGRPFGAPRGRRLIRA